jgi:preprotein translocase subunit SecB
MTNATNGGEAAAAPPEGPSLSVITQYIKDFSFENPNAPNSLLQQQQPQIGIQINVNPRQMSATDFEVELKLEGKAELIGSILFAFDLNYAGVFRLVNIPQENLGPLLMIEGPRPVDTEYSSTAQLAMQGSVEARGASKAQPEVGAHSAS